MYDHALIMVICRLEIVVGLELGVGVLGIDSLKVEVTRKVLVRLFFFYKSNYKVIDPIAQSVIELCWMS